MTKIVRVAAIGLLGLVLVVVCIIGAGMGYRAYRQREIARAIAITTPDGIDEAMFVRIGDIDQWVTIRSVDRDNPVLLYLMGGPGDTMIPRAYALYRPW